MPKAMSYVTIAMALNMLLNRTVKQTVFCTLHNYLYIETGLISILQMTKDRSPGRLLPKGQRESWDKNLLNPRCPAVHTG